MTAVILALLLSVVPPDAEVIKKGKEQGWLIYTNENKCYYITEISVELKLDPREIDEKYCS